MQYLKLYYSDTEITAENPLKVGPLNATNNEVSSALAVTLKVEAGYETYGNTTISFEGASNAKWTICATELGEYASTLTISEVINSTGKVFYVKAKATEDESPSNDPSVQIKVESVISAV